MIPKSLNYALKYYRLWGFHCIPSTSCCEKWISTTIFLCQTGLCALYSWACVRMYIEINQAMSFFDAINVLAYDITSIITYFLIIYDSHSTIKAQRAFWENFSHNCEQYDLNTRKIKVKWRDVIALIFLLIGIVISCLSTILGGDQDASRTLEQILCYFTECVLDHRILFYFLHVEVICCQLRTINVNLMQIRAETIGEIKTQMQCISRHLNLIFKMVDQMNTIFGWSQLAVVALNFQSALTILNTCYQQINGKFDQFDESELCDCYLKCSMKN